MGVWLQSKGSVHALRDGKGLEAPMLGVSPDGPTYFRHREPSDHLHDKDVAIVEKAAPGTAYKGPSYDELREAFRRRRAESAKKLAERSVQKHAVQAAAVKAKRPKKTSKRLEELDAEADRGEREVI